MPAPARNSFSDQERAFLEGIAAKLPPEAAERLRRDVEIAIVQREDDFLHVELPGYVRPAMPTQRGLPFEGRMYAADGGALSVFVNMDRNDRLLEVEFVHWESPNDVAPDWSTLRIVPEAPKGVSRW